MERGERKSLLTEHPSVLVICLAQEGLQGTFGASRSLAQTNTEGPIQHHIAPCQGITSGSVPCSASSWASVGPESAIPSRVTGGGHPSLSLSGGLEVAVGSLPVPCPMSLFLFTSINSAKPQLRETFPRFFHARCHLQSSYFRDWIRLIPPSNHS